MDEPTLPSTESGLLPEEAAVHSAGACRAPRMLATQGCSSEQPCPRPHGRTGEGGSTQQRGAQLRARSLAAGGGGQDAELHRAWRGGWGPGPGALPSRGPGLAKPARRCRPGLRAPALRAVHRNRRERAQVTVPGCSQGNGGTGTSGPWKLEKQARKTKVCGDSQFVLCEEAGGRKQVEKRVLNYEYSS